MKGVLVLVVILAVLQGRLWLVTAREVPGPRGCPVVATPSVRDVGDILPGHALDAEYDLENIGRRPCIIRHVATIGSCGTETSLVRASGRAEDVKRASVHHVGAGERVRLRVTMYVGLGGNGVELLAHDLVVADGVRAWPLRVIARVRRPEVAVLEPVEMASMGAWTSFRVRFREPVACSVGADRNWVSTPVDGNLLEWVIAGRRRGRLPWIEAATWPSGDLTYYYLIDRSRTRPGRR